MTAEQENNLIKSVYEIKNALLGNPVYGIEGLASKVERHEDFIKEAERKKWIAFGAGIAGTATVPHLVNLIINFF